MAILVIGGAGFVGSHLVDRFVADGERVLIVDNLAAGSIPNIESALASGRATFAFADAGASSYELSGLVRKAGFERLPTVFDCFSAASSALSADREDLIAKHRSAAASAIDLAIQYGARLVVLSGVSNDFGAGSNSASRTDLVNVAQSTSMQEDGRRLSDARFMTAVLERGLRGRIVRVFDAYGPRMDQGDGLMALFDAVVAGRPVPIYGTGSQTRLMTFVADIVDGVCRVMRSSSHDSLTIDLGSEEETSVISIAEQVAELAGVPFVADYRPARSDDLQPRAPERGCPTVDGWTARTAMRDGLSATYSWFCRHRVLHA